MSLCTMGEWCGMVLMVMVVALQGRPFNIMSMSASPIRDVEGLNNRLVAIVVIVLATIRTYHHLGLTRKTPRHSVSCCSPLPSPATVCAACSGPSSAWQCQA